MATPRRVPLADDIPAGRAWRQGRRLYVAFSMRGVGSRLQMEFQDGHWDTDVGATWIGITRTVNVDRIADAIRAELAARAAHPEVKLPPVDREKVRTAELWRMDREIALMEQRISDMKEDLEILRTRRREYADDAAQADEPAASGDGGQG